MFHMLQKATEIAKMHSLSGFRVIVNVGREGGQEIDHLHLHVLGGGKLPGF
jgi:histidine triad (HIT) family protein